MIKFLCSPSTISYDVLVLLEESYENMENDNYWEFLSPPVDDSSIPFRIMLDPLLSICMEKEVFPVISEVHIIFHPIRPPYEHSQHHLVASIEEIVQPFLPYLGKPLMAHFNKVRACRWIGMIFIPQLHSVYCLSFHLKHEGMNYFFDNFKISRIIGIMI